MLILWVKKYLFLIFKQAFGDYLQQKYENRNKTSGHTIATKELKSRYYIFISCSDLLVKSYSLGWTLFQTMFGGRNSMSRSTFGSHNDKKNRWNYFLLTIKWLQNRCTYIAILIYHSLVTFVILWCFVIIIDYNVDKFGNSVVFFNQSC